MIKQKLSFLDKTCEKQAFLIWVLSGVGAPFQQSKTIF
jgi:hypothetical protein